MVTVAELVEDVAELLKERRETVSAFARALIDANMLPKSRGRAIAHIEPIHVWRLLFITAMNPKIKDAGPIAKLYGELMRDGVPKSAPKKLKGTADEYICEMLTLVFTEPGNLNEEGKKLRSAYVKSQIEVVENWPEISVETPWDDGSVTARFKGDGRTGHWSDVFKRSASISCMALIMIGNAHRRDYVAMFNP